MIERLVKDKMKILNKQIFRAFFKKNLTLALAESKFESGR